MPGPVAPGPHPERLACLPACLLQVGCRLHDEAAAGRRDCGGTGRQRRGRSQVLEEHRRAGQRGLPRVPHHQQGARWAASRLRARGRHCHAPLGLSSRSGRCWAKTDDATLPAAALSTWMGQGGRALGVAGFKAPHELDSLGPCCRLRPGGWPGRCPGRCLNGLQGLRPRVQREPAAPGSAILFCTQPWASAWSLQPWASVC
jgi:hypothetical protein